MAEETPKTTVNIENLEFSTRNIFSSKGARVTSDLVGPAQSFRCKVRVHPQGRRGQRLVGVFLVVVPPKHLKHSDWSCPDVTYSFLIQRNHNVLSRTTTCTFAKKTDKHGWNDMFQGRTLQEFVGEDGELRIKAQVLNLPYVQPPTDLPRTLFADLDFSQETKMLTFRLAEGAALFFDQRLLMDRSEYFRQMLTSSEWEESRSGEVDFRGDPQVTKPIMQVILLFILTNSFQAGSLDFTVEVRKLADRFCLSSLVDQVDREMEKMLNEKNVLQILAEIYETGSPVERCCWKMLESDCTILAKHEDVLDTLIAEKPTLARKLILLGRTKRQRRG